MQVSIWLWIGFNLFVVLMLAIDLGVFHRDAHEVSTKEAGTWTVVWIACALAFNVEVLIGFRIMQGLAGGGVTVVGTAIVKDLFDGRERERVMATVMSLVIIAPMIAPVLGAFLLKVASWHMMFVALAIFGCCATLLV